MEGDKFGVSTTLHDAINIFYFVFLALNTKEQLIEHWLDAFGNGLNVLFIMQGSFSP